MSFCYSKSNLKQLDQNVVWKIFFVFCLLRNEVCDSATRTEQIYFSARDIRLDAFGRHFGVGSPDNKVSGICQDCSEMYLQTVANFTPWIFKSKFTFLCMYLIIFNGDESRDVK